MVTAATNKQEAIDRITAVRDPLLAHGVRRLALFGSFSRNQQHANSDVDLLLEFMSGRKSFDNFIAICELLENSLQRRVEVVTRESLSPHIGPRILNEAEDVILAD
ncbi:MAG: nucleotidyltransferase family protein [Bythopirellula sp.]|nr:nucleotidyltransferase family protein [Bythopirellula sp.]